MTVPLVRSAIAAISILAVVTLPAESGTAPIPPQGMVYISGGSYKPLYAREAQIRTVEPFFMDTVQVTNGQFLEFVKAHPEYQRSKIGRALADETYLKHWAGDVELGPETPHDAPVTQVSWFAARAYCEASGKRLPTQDEWELVARADATQRDATKDQAFPRQLLEWYAKPTNVSLPSVNEGAMNIYGLRGLHGLVWEWVEDFNSTMIVGDSRGDGSLDRQLFCGAGSLAAADVGNYAAYMRYAFRSSLKGDYCVASLGFRGARSANDARPPGANRPMATVYDLPGVWRTQNGEAIRLEAFRGKPRLITMGFTSCKYACPRIIADLRRIESALGAQADKIGIIFFSFDSKTDTPAKMKRTLEEHHLDSQRWTFAVSSDDAIRQLAVALNFKFQSVDGIFAHSNLILLLDADGNIVHREEFLGADSEPTVQAVRKLLRP
jgi:formylglycine-generating enzyme required for sulfatase activity/cytochrome oxidase Cu insertion factor (SCO1/SenC/PrrC family)